MKNDFRSEKKTVDQFGAKIFVGGVTSPKKYRIIGRIFIGATVVVFLTLITALVYLEFQEEDQQEATVVDSVNAADIRLDEVELEQATTWYVDNRNETEADD
jgi:hypothetical protein